MIVVAGEALIDLLAHPDGRLDAVPGGGPFNTARTIARLGGEVRFLGCLSTDRFGERLVTPGPPVHRVVRVLEQVRAGRILQPVHVSTLRAARRPLITA